MNTFDLSHIVLVKAGLWEEQIGAWERKCRMEREGEVRRVSTCLASTPLFLPMASVDTGSHNAFHSHTLGNERAIRTDYDWWVFLKRSVKQDRIRRAKKVTIRANMWQKWERTTCRLLCMWMDVHGQKSFQLLWNMFQ